MQLGQLKIESRLSQQSEPYWAFKRSQMMESQLEGEPHCSRHQHCAASSKIPLSQQPFFSVDSALLQQFSVEDVRAQPLHQYTHKAEVDILAMANIKKKKFQQLLLEEQMRSKNEKQQKMVDKVQQEAKQALQKCPKKPYKPQAKWGHNIFNQQTTQQKGEKGENKKEIEKKGSKQKRKVEMKPINERIAQYRRKQSAQKHHKTQQCALKQVRSQDSQTQNIAENANRILEGMKKEKQEQEMMKKATQAKIRAIQLYSKERVLKGKKNPLRSDEEEFDLGDSRYSTFSARAKNRRMPEKNKNKKAKHTLQSSSQIPLAQTKKSGIKKPRSTAHLNAKATPKVKQKQTETQKVEMEATQEIPKGPFYIWNIPVYEEDLQKLDKEENKTFMGVDRFNYKSGKTFREQASQLLAERAQAKVAERIQVKKQLTFEQTVEKKKQELLAQYDQEVTPPAFAEHFWNEDQLFKESVFQNFHFYPK